jgi:hypothetical protein
VTRIVGSSSPKCSQAVEEVATTAAAGGDGVDGEEEVVVGSRRGLVEETVSRLGLRWSPWTPQCTARQVRVAPTPTNTLIRVLLRTWSKDIARVVEVWSLEAR